MLKQVLKISKNNPVIACNITWMKQFVSLSADNHGYCRYDTLYRKNHRKIDRYVIILLSKITHV